MFKKKQAVLAALVFMIGLAGYFNWSYQHSENGVVSDTEDSSLGEARLVSGTNIMKNEDFFADSRREREEGRSKAQESLREVCENPGSTPEAKKEAEIRLMDMAGRMEMEAAAEAEIKAKGFSDAVVYINSGSASVIVEKDGELTASEAAKLQEIIIRIAGIDSSAIGISVHKKV
ncbi:MAG: SpoIIIAH-like family protein [Clostridia bacterium]|nr:SpoIIIAH-like family protein [Clostridia bacterium]